MKLAFPQSLAGRLIFWLLTSLLVLQLGFFFLQEFERKQAIHRVLTQSAHSRAATIARLLQEVEPDLWATALEQSSSIDVSMNIDTTRVFEGQHSRREWVIHDRKVGVGEQRILVKIETDPQDIAQPSLPDLHRQPHRIDHPPSFVLPSSGKPMAPMRVPPFEVFPGAVGASVQLPDGRWLNTKVRPASLGPGDWRSWLPLFSSGVLLILVVIAVVHFETRSMKGLALAADKLGRGEKLPPLAESGPRETRITLRAFNRMGQRLQRFVGDRTQMLAAMSHDMRTPLTSMRLRVEELPDAELRAKLIDSIEEMKQMADATLAFARADAADEPSSETDLSKLITCVVTEFVELEQPVNWEPTNQQTASIRPLAMKRAVRNLVENAIRYGGSAAVVLRQVDDKILIEIADEGPGIQPDDLGRVFEPFTRLESSRNRETGGAGLGLSIARSIVRSHGGELELQNRNQGGLLARIVLQGHS